MSQSLLRARSISTRPPSTCRTLTDCTGYLSTIMLVQLGQVLEGWCSQRGNGQTGCERRENQIGMSLVYHHNTCVDTDKETGSHMYSVEKG
ncbi:hypothetical protein [Phaffia rhodozyma]|uniref:Uncharacterized protein n=1 Tax=Phaffia rhodozyma TaxID=264483 RepID=A0A0F7SIQ1_PHARH|nr:hypothetical protein [Phaffia rhodozyma]